MRMAIIPRKASTIFVILVSYALLLLTCSAAVTDTVCDPNTNGATVCTDVDPNAECPAGSENCECKSGYQEDKLVVNTCAKVLGGQCPANVDCTVANSECSGPTCSCLADYQEVNDLCEKAVTDTVCDPNDDGATVCAGVDPNAECPAGGENCECKSGYQEDKIIVNTCAKVLGEQCPANVDCTVENSECSETTCSCVAGYKEVNDLCEKVLTGTCSADGHCTATVANSECSSLKCSCVAGYKEANNICEKVLTGQCASHGDCTGTVVNSECSSLICSCVDGYKEDSNICVKIPVSETKCDAGDNDCTFEHSECDKAETSPKCKCSDGYEEDSNDRSTCVKIAESSATSAWMASSLLVTSMLINLTRFILW